RVPRRASRARPVPPPAASPRAPVWARAAARPAGPARRAGRPRGAPRRRGARERFRGGSSRTPLRAGGGGAAVADLRPVLVVGEQRAVLAVVARRALVAGGERRPHLRIADVPGRRAVAALAADRPGALGARDGGEPARQAVARRVALLAVRVDVVAPVGERLPGVGVLRAVPFRAVGRVARAA